MSASSMLYPECCQYCPHLQTIQGSCGHELRQSLIQGLAEGEKLDSPCPVFDQWHAEKMQELSVALES